MLKRLILPIMLLSVLFIAPLATAAVDTSPQTNKTVIQSEEAGTPKVEYNLPYPGIGPDHPLYVLKAARDWLLDKLIVDPVRKVEFYILQGDKRLQMGINLIVKNKNTLAEQVVSKGEKYQVKAVAALAALKKSGTLIPGYLLDRLENSLAKHVEVLEEQIAKAGGPEKFGLQGSLELVKQLQAEVVKLK